MARCMRRVRAFRPSRSRTLDRAQPGNAAFTSTSDDEIFLADHGQFDSGILGGQTRRAAKVPTDFHFELYKVARPAVYFRRRTLERLAAANRRRRIPARLRRRRVVPKARGRRAGRSSWNAPWRWSARPGRLTSPTGGGCSPTSTCWNDRTGHDRPSSAATGKVVRRLRRQLHALEVSRASRIEERSTGSAAVLAGTPLSAVTGVGNPMRQLVGVTGDIACHCRIAEATVRLTSADRVAA